MNVIDALTAIVKGPVTVVADFFKHRAEVQSKERIRRLEIEDAMHTKRLARITEGETLDTQWELEQLKNSGWKDEWVLMVLSFPYVFAFCPWFADDVLNGFKVIGETPDWYRWLVLMVFAAVYGIRIWRRKQAQ